MKARTVGNGVVARKMEYARASAAQVGRAAVQAFTTRRSSATMAAWCAATSHPHAVAPLLPGWSRVMLLDAAQSHQPSTTTPPPHRELASHTDIRALRAARQRTAACTHRPRYAACLRDAPAWPMALALAFRGVCDTMETPSDVTMPTSPLRVALYCVSSIPPHATAPHTLQGTLRVQCLRHCLSRWHHLPGHCCH